MFKKLLFLSSILFLTFTLTAQIGVGPRESMSAGSGNFNKDDIEKLKNSKTVFLYRKDDNLDKLKKAITEVWDFTEISFKPYSEKDKIPVNTSIFNISGFTASNSGGTASNTYSYSHKYIKLWLKTEKGKKGEEIGITFARIELSSATLVKSGEHYNWSIGFVKTYLKFVNDQLKTGEERWLYKEVENYDELNKLENKTLYVPSFLFYTMGRYGLTEEEFDKYYPYKYEILKKDEISKKILESEEPVLFLISITSDTEQFTSIYNSKTGDIIYNDYGHSLTSTVNKKDIKNLGKSLKKAKKKK